MIRWPALLLLLPWAFLMLISGCAEYVSTVTLNLRNVDTIRLDDVVVLVASDSMFAGKDFLSANSRHRRDRLVKNDSDFTGYDSYPMGDCPPGDARVIRVKVARESPISMQHGRIGAIATRRVRFVLTTYSEADGKDPQITIEYNRDGDVKVTKLDLKKDDNARGTGGPRDWRKPGGPRL